MKIPLPKSLRTRVDESTWLNQTTARKNFILPYILLTLGLLASGGIYASQRSNTDEQQTRNTELNTYVIAANTYTQCVIRSGSRDDLRSALNDLFDFLEDLANRFEALDIAADVAAAQVEFNTKYQPVPIETCGLPPDPPNGVHPIPFTVPTTLIPKEN